MTFHEIVDEINSIYRSKNLLTTVELIIVHLIKNTFYKLQNEEIQIAEFVPDVHSSRFSVADWPAEINKIPDSKYWSIRTTRTKQSDFFHFVVYKNHLFWNEQFVTQSYF